VIRVRNKKRFKGPGIYVGRPSPLGNPWRMDSNDPDSRAKVIEKYREWFLERMRERSSPQRRAVERIVALAKRQDIDLVCWCAPLPCHADVIKEYIESILARRRSGGRRERQK